MSVNTDLLSFVGILHIDATNRLPSCAGIVLITPSKIYEASKIILGGKSRMVNECEYASLIFGLQYARSKGVRRIDVYSDSQLMVYHMIGDYKVRAANLLPFYEKANLERSKFEWFDIHWKRREQNIKADSLSKRGFDSEAIIVNKSFDTASVQHMIRK